MKQRLLTAFLLLVITVVLWRMTRPTKPPAPNRNEAEAISLTVDIQKLTVRKTGGHGHLSLTALFQQSGAAPLRLVPPLVSLRTASGESTPRFIGPLVPEPVLPDRNPAAVTLHYWLTETDLAGPLTLEAGGQKYPLPTPENTGSTPR